MTYCPAGGGEVCLLLLAKDEHPDYSLVLAANRDEFYSRPTSPAGWWSEADDVLGGKDVKAGGTWLAIRKDGRLAALTNVRNPAREQPGRKSRGKLVRDWVSSHRSVDEYRAELLRTTPEFNGYNLIFGSVDQLFCFSNTDGVMGEVGVGLHGLSNARLNSPWPKVTTGKDTLGQCLRDNPSDLEEHLLEILDDRTEALDDDLPDTGIGLLRERALSPRFIHLPQVGYGTRSSTLILFGTDGLVSFIERTFSDAGKPVAEREYRFSITS
jgi:uncharacterized protein with NRDE domain